MGSFIWRVTLDWELAKENLQRVVGLQQKYYDKKHRDIQYTVRDFVLLSTKNVKMRGILDKLKKCFMETFKIQERIGKQAYKLLLPKTWKVHPVFHISLLKKWNVVDLEEEKEFPTEELEVEEPYYEIEKLLKWRK